MCLLLRNVRASFSGLVLTSHLGSTLGSMVVLQLLANTITIFLLLILCASMQKNNYLRDIHIGLRILLPFRLWLDAARLLFLLILHIGKYAPERRFLLHAHSISIGLAVAFTYLNTKLECPNQSTTTISVTRLTLHGELVAAEEEGICRLVNVYMVLASWVIPGFRKYLINHSPVNTHL